ncbi:MAG: hypothetical protein ACXVAD_03600 [Syntrophales bacterium]
MIRTGLTVLAVCMFAACATPSNVVNRVLSTFDNNTEYSVEENDSGFSITVYYSRLEVVESTEAAKACKQQLAAVAWTYAKNKQKEIEPITEQQIKISMDRSVVKGRTSCQADAVVSWKKP